MLTQWIYIKNSDELAKYLTNRQDLTLIGRINYRDSQVPGFVRVENGICFASFRGGPTFSRKFHVLSFGREFNWQVYRFPDPLPPNAFVAGYDTVENVPCYLGRIHRDSDTREYLYGRVLPGQKKLEIAIRNKVLEVLLFEILVINWVWIKARRILIRTISQKHRLE